MALASAASALALTAWIALEARQPEVGWTIASLGGLGGLLLLLGGILRAELAAPGVVLLGAAYAILLAVDGGELDRRAPIVAAALLVSCELAYWAHELRTGSTGEPGSHARRISWLAVLALLALALGGTLLAVVDVARVEGVAVDVLGATAAAAAFLLLWLIARDAGRR